MKCGSPLFLYNTKTKSLENVRNSFGVTTRIYTCGPTVYQRAHIGNMRAYVFADTLNRALRFLGYKPKHIINITDVGHLTGDMDAGEDKIEKQAQADNAKAKDIVHKFTTLFFIDLKRLHIPIKRYIFPRATSYVKEQIAFIKKLEKKGHIYAIEDGIYFDTASYPAYGAFGSSTQTSEDYSRIKTVTGKKQPQDFALWKRTPKGVTRQQEWDSPWGRGFPGWHLECSTMAIHLLGETINIHTGGIDHIAIHHTNEIAQSESVTGKPFAYIWSHVAFLTYKKEKFSKSLNNTYSLDDIIAKGYDPIALRYLFLQASYRNPLSFSLSSLQSANTALMRLRYAYSILPQSFFIRKKNSSYCKAIKEAVADDLNTAKVLALVWQLVHDSSIHPTIRRNTLRYADTVLGILGKTQVFQENLIPHDVQILFEERVTARSTGDYRKADKLRDQILALGYTVTDTANAPGSVTKSTK